MSGLHYKSSDWEDQLLQVRGALRSGEKGGFEPNRHRRKRQYRDRRSAEDLWVTEVTGNKEVGSNGGIGLVENQGVHNGFEGFSDVGSHAAEGDYNGEAPMSDNNQDQYPFEDDGYTHRSNRGKELRQSKPEGERRYESEETEEEKAERKKNERINAKVRKGLIWGTASLAATAVAICGAAVITGLLGKHKSNFMNMGSGSGSD
jgi:hypothetical protein